MTGGHVRRRNNRWQARFRGPDRRERSKTFDRKIDAEQWLIKQASEIQRGLWFDPTAGQITFGEWWPIYMSRANKRPSTVARDEGAARKWLLPHLEHVPLAAITTTMVDRIISDMQAAGLAPSSVRTFYGVLQGAMTAAVDDDRIARSPCRRRDLKVERRKDPRFISIDEIHHLASIIDPRYRALVYLAGVVGLRFGECAALRVGRINFFKRDGHRGGDSQRGARPSDLWRAEDEGVAANSIDPSTGRVRVGSPPGGPRAGRA